MEQFANPETNVSLPSLGEGIKKITAPDKSTVVIELEYPVAAFLYNIAVFPAFVVPKAKVESEGAAFWKHPVSSGPFVMKEFASGSHITFENNPYYFEKGKPYLQTMRWNFVPNSNTRVLELKSGQANIADGIPFNQVESLQGESGLTVQKVEFPQEALLILNNKVKALGDVHVRRALSLAINREQLNEAVFRGTGTIPNSVIQNFELDASDQEVPTVRIQPRKSQRRNGEIEIRQRLLGQHEVPGRLRLLQADVAAAAGGAEGNRRQREAGRRGSVDDRRKVAGRRIRNDLPVRRHLLRHPGAGRVRQPLRPAGSRTRRVQIVLAQRRSGKTGPEIHHQHR